MRIGCQGNAGIFQNVYCQLSTHRREVLEKYLQRVACFEVLKKHSNWYTTPSENWRSTENFAVNNDVGGIHVCTSDARVVDSLQRDVQ